MHCSGGVGRSGTFLSAFAAMASTLWAGAPWPGAEFSLLPTVRALRSQRHPMCVEGIAQLGFAYECVADALEQGAGRDVRGGA